jgi:hypothetical protein
MWIGKRNISLRSINMRNNAYINDDSILALARNCPYLTSLNISNITNNNNIGDNSMIELADNCTALQILNILNRVELV